MATFDPLSAARHVLATTKLTDPDDVAEKVFTQTPKGAIRAAYKVLLRSVAREAMRTTRMDAGAEPRRVPNRSSKVAAIRDHHVDYFDQRVFAQGQWKLLGDCSPEDVLDLAAQRYSIAAKNTAKGDEYTDLHKAMVAAGAKRARDLGEVAA